MGGTLFETKPRAEPVKTPAWLLRALAKHGFPEHVTRKWTARACFAKLNEIKADEKSVKELGAADHKTVRRHVAGRILRLVNDPQEPTPDELWNLISGSVATLSESEKRRVALGIAKLLDPGNQESASA